MRSDDLYITTVPCFFKCPISLDVMKSPVSLSTGVTYDRVSIQRWLDGGNNTCPATMQILQNKEFVPNLTLHRLIDLWSDSINRRAGSESPESDTPTKEDINDAIERIRIENDDCDVLSKILRFAKESDENREFLAGKDDFVGMLVDLISQFDSRHFSDSQLILVGEAVKILSIIRRKIFDQRRLSNLILSNGGDCLTAIFLLMKSGNSKLKTDCSAVLEFIAVDAESKLIIAERDGLVIEIMKSISSDSDSSLIEASLSLLIAIASSKRVKLALIREKLVTKLTSLLTDPTTSVSVTEKCLKLLEAFSSCKEGRSEICAGACVETVVKKLMKVSTAATEHAVTVLWSVCYLFKEKKAQDAVIRTNGVTKILLLLQSNCSLTVRHMLTDLLKVLKVNSRSCLYTETKTTHIMPF
ncbi:U box domain [Arabidopsis thaliana x Arabidopsis arenosa]|uniref:U-box domain-containing protein n=1 Tax=Arabidopsis thaliana x Arabidopsis arenosa TaxID=1240361 RepID=A0A8T1YVE6_9BRAS|nr:U box domain [Arabidopsis thaliana x Arabidopsis arenosa]